MITINRNRILPIIGLISALMIICSLRNSDNYLLSFLTFIYFVTTPGFLILLTLRLTRLDVWKVLVFSIGLSLFFLMFTGVLFNWLLHLLYQTPPLQKELLVVNFGVLLLILFIIAYFRNYGLHLNIHLNFFNIQKISYFIIPPIFTILSIFAAFLLNNTGNGSLAIATVSGIALTMLATIILHRRLDENFFPWSLYFHSLSLLLIISLRSWYVSGWDIQNEFKVFQLTKQLGFWSPKNINDAYNACLSITLLPTIISKLTAFPDDYIYKFLYQILFAITPVILYKTYRRYTSNLIAFISIIYIIAQPLFIQPMTALMRQEIAFIFFALMLYTIFDSKLSTKLHAVFFLTFSLGMTVSHYSTTYIGLFIFAFMYLLISIYRLSEKIGFINALYEKLKITSNIKFYRYYLNPLFVVVLFIYTFFWYGYINNQLGQVQKVAQEGLSRMNELFKSDLKSVESKNVIPFLKKDITTSEQLENYTRHELIKVGGDNFRLYPSKSYADNNVYPITLNFVRPLLRTTVNQYIFIVSEYLKQILKLFVIFGPLYLFIIYFRKTIFPREDIALGGVSVLIITIMTFHPTLGLHYNLSRFYLQLLFMLALSAMFISVHLLSPVKKFSSSIVGFLIIALFIYLTGLSYQLLGGEAKLYFNNYGADYDKFYVHGEELVSAKWLEANIPKHSTLFADQEANLRIFRIFSRSYNHNLLPALIYQDAYVYGSYANVINNRTSIYTGESNMVFSFPQTFLNENKNIIYTNGNSKIYR